MESVTQLSGRRFEALDAFRGLCALAVVLYHVRITGTPTEWAFFRGSSMMVEFFFVLSGFVLAHSYQHRSNLKFSNYFKARFFRIFPLHIVMLGVFIVLEGAKLFAEHKFNIQFNNPAFVGKNSVEQIIPNLLLIQSWSDSFSSGSFNYPAWSISVEFLMYLLLFGILHFAKRYRVLIWSVISSLMLYTLATKSFITTNEITKGLACFFGGCLVYQLYLRIYMLELSKNVGSAIELIVLSVTIYIIQADLDHGKILSIAAFFTTVLVFSLESGVISQLLRVSIFQLFGKLSYSVYLVHAAIIFCLNSGFILLQKVTNKPLAPMINGDRFIDTGDMVLNYALLLLLIVLVVGVSWFTYHYIEKVGIKLGKQTTPNKAQQVASG